MDDEARLTKGRPSSLVPGVDDVEGLIIIDPAELSTESLAVLAAPDDPALNTYRKKVRWRVRRLLRDLFPLSGRPPTRELLIRAVREKYRIPTDIIQCPVCGGRGYVTEAERLGGEKEVGDGKWVCWECDGDGETAL